jgi:hypothetical protein
MQATQQTSEAALNQMNLQMRQQPWYQQWFAQQGLDPNHVRLNDRQREQLAALAGQNGFELAARMKIDEAGNLNQKGGWAGMSPAMKAAIIAAAAVGTAGIATTGALGSTAQGLVGAGGGGGGGGVGAYGTGSGLNAASAGAGFHAGSPLLMTHGASLLPGAAWAGNEVADVAMSGIPQTASSQIGSGMGTTPVFGPDAASGGGLGKAAVAGATGGATSTARGYGGKVADALTGGAGGLGDSAIRAALSALAGLPGLLSSQNGPSDEERAYQAQATRLLGQQEQRTQYQNPLYSAVTKMAYGLLPQMGNGGNPYPMNSLEDVKVPGLDELLRAQQR